MTHIYHLNKGDQGEIIAINAGKTLKARMKSFGIYAGVVFEIKAFSMGKNNVELQVGNGLVALRKGEMDKIEVKKIDDKA